MVSNPLNFGFCFERSNFLLIVSIAIKAITSYFQSKYIRYCEYSLSKRLFERYLYQPYSWFLNHHSTDLGKTILSEVNAVVGGAINPLFEVIAKGMVAIALITLLILADPKIALVVGFTLGSIYGCIFFFLSKLDY